MQQKNNLNTGLVLLAAGFGTRFGGNKQLRAIGPENAMIMDYTIYDAWRIGYSWVTVILRDEIADEFKREVGQRWQDKIELRYSIQSGEAHVPDKFLAAPYVTQRSKHWGTAHALLCAAEQVDGPFAVTNADDFYGYHGLEKIFSFLRETVLPEQNAPAKPDAILRQSMVSFRLDRTLSENGTVSRGICHTYFDPQGREWLDNIREHTQLIRGKDSKIHSIQGESGDDLILNDETPVSMNLFGLQPQIFPHLQRQFETFLQGLEDNIGKESLEQTLKKEFYLPSVVETMLKAGQTEVAMLHSPDPWFGLTYLEDLATARQHMEQLIRALQYPAKLFAPGTAS
ncbi:NTP transferase domain-containing protein [Candidatus Haliotispira prima]|uniref:NTP transferase domain-containing protein n=1 Tax=Candidatus Haliotispira prima TaxID=3034016 RepID=A0ABY8MI70_9SPIO|nr:NTP transferase domain-containing protein [Candidatus Haliotispira prima]